MRACGTAENANAGLELDGSFPGRKCVGLASDDFFASIGEPIVDLDATRHSGSRFPVEVLLDGRVIVGFHSCVGKADDVMEPAEVIAGRDSLGSVGKASHRCA